MVFTCTVASQKIASACVRYDMGSMTLSEAARNPALVQTVSMTYRYGRKGAVELSLPVKPKEFDPVIHVSEVVSHDPLDDDLFIRFAHKQYSYALYTSIVDGVDFAGLAIFKGHELLKKESCLPGSSDFRASWQTLTNIGVPTELDGDSLRFWKAILPADSRALHSLFAKHE